MKRNKRGMTIIEVVISFTIALILIMALYSIVYWGSTGFSDLNQKLIDVGNASIYIKTELTQNAGKYFYLEPVPGLGGQYLLKMNTNTPNKIFDLINTKGYNRYNKIRTIRIREPQRVNNTNLYKVEVEIEYEHKNLIRTNRFDVYLAANSFKVAPIGFNTIDSVDVGTFTVVNPTTTETNPAAEYNNNYNSKYNNNYNSKYNNNYNSKYNNNYNSKYNNNYNSKYNNNYNGKYNNNYNSKYNNNYNSKYNNYNSKYNNNYNCKYNNKYYKIYTTNSSN